MSAAEAAKVIPLNEEIELSNQALTLYERVTMLTINDQASYEGAAELGKQLKELEKKITDYFEPLRVAAKSSYDAVLEKKKTELTPVMEAMTALRATMNVFVREQERIRQEEERKARIRAEEDAKREQEKLLAQAAKAEEKGQDVKAESLAEKAANVYAEPVAVAPTIAKTVALASGGNVTQAKELQITVADPKVFISEILKRNMALTMIEVKPGPLKAWVKANGLESFPGLVIKQTVGVRL